MITIWVGIGIGLDNIRKISENVILDLRKHGEDWNESDFSIGQVLQLVQPLARLGAMLVRSILTVHVREFRLIHGCLGLAGFNYQAIAPWIHCMDGTRSLHDSGWRTFSSTSGGAGGWQPF